MVFIYENNYQGCAWRTAPNQDALVSHLAAGGGGLSDSHNTH